ncbi:glycosyltransferase family 1 protein [Compostibacter hankyongensis]|uniref:Glycosyltransferase family 1 protein n=1 Tax=Compostibacter hankyongensis TaxID=1007089 RepID=A0ABP8G8G4_9BACT
MSGLFFDVRMINDSGIGTYIRNILPPVSGIADTTVLGRNRDGCFRNLMYRDFDYPVYSVREQLAYYRLRKDLKAGFILFSPHYNIPVYPLSCKRVVTIHDVYHLAFLDDLSVGQKVYAKFMIRRAIAKSDKIITVSDFSKKEIIRYCNDCDPEKISVIRNGIRQRSKIENLDEIRFRYGLPEKYLLFVGNVKPHKNLKRFLKAYLLLDNSIKDKYKIVVVGKKSGFITGDPLLHKQVAEDRVLSSNIIFTGFVAEEDMDTIYGHASLFVFPSLYEGFGFPPLEAMVNGCPVVVSDTASLPEVCGEAALYFNPYDVYDIRDKIDRVLKDHDLREKLIEKGRDRVRKFTWEASSRKHVELLRSLIRDEV